MCREQDGRGGSSQRPAIGRNSVHAWQTAAEYRVGSWAKGHQGRTYAINTDTVVVTVHESAEYGADCSSRTFATRAEFESTVEAYSLADLVRIWNSLAATRSLLGLKQVGKFTDRKTAVRRLWTAIQRLDAMDNHEPAESSSPPRKVGTSSPEPGSKAAMILDLLRGPEGATAQEIASLVNWKRHSVRGFISGTLVKRMGLTIESRRRESGDRVYRVRSSDR